MKIDLKEGDIRRTYRINNKTRINDKIIVESTTKCKREKLMEYV